MATLLASFKDGWERVGRAPAVLLGVWLLTLLVALPAGLAIEQSVADSLGQSLDAGRMADGADGDWWARFEETANGLDRTFTPTIIGFGAVLDNLSRIVDGGSLPLAAAGLVAAYLLLWLFLAGGIIGRYARRRRMGAQGFYGACGTFFARFLRLAIIGAIGYAFLFVSVRAWLFDDLYGWATRDLTVERTAFAIRAGLYTVFLGLAAFWNAVMDYAKIRSVVEDRRSMLGAFLAGWRFVTGHPLKAGGLYLLNAAGLLGVILVYALAAPGAAGSGWIAWAGFLAGQAFLLARLAVKLAFLSTQTALFQRSLAKLAYSALPDPVWPESPAADAPASASSPEAGRS